MKPEAPESELASLIRALIERGQARIIALECNFLPGRALNNYVQTGEGDPVQLATAAVAPFYGKLGDAQVAALKGALESAWTFANWLTHSKSATWVDAELAHGLIQHAISMASSLILRGLRGVPEACPDCGSPHLEPEQGENTAAPGVLGRTSRVLTYFAGRKTT